MKIFLFITLWGFYAQTKPTLSVKISQLSSTNGKVFLQVLDLNQNVVHSSVLTIPSKNFTWTSPSIPDGKYAVKIFHDENNNGKMDTNFVGIPKEKWGTSNNVKAKFAPPNFKEMIFDFPSQKEIIVFVNN